MNASPSCAGAEPARAEPRRGTWRTCLLGAGLLCAAWSAQADISISLGLTPYGYVPYPGPVAVYPPGPGTAYYPPPVIYLGDGEWGRDGDRLEQGRWPQPPPRRVGPARARGHGPGGPGPAPHHPGPGGPIRR